jgi:hypothetical protein
MPDTRSSSERLPEWPGWRFFLSRSNNSKISSSIQLAPSDDVPETTKSPGHPNLG